MEKLKLKLEELRTNRNLLWNKRDYLQDKLRNYQGLLNRSKCPICDQDIDYHYFEDKIPNIKSKLQTIINKLETIYPKIRELEKPISEAYNSRVKKKREEVVIYLRLNRNKLNKSIRDYDKGINSYLPNIQTIKEKELWNNAMEIQLDNKGLDDNEELTFEI